MSAAVVSLYALDPAMPVLLRPDGAVQVGWDPRRAVLVRPPGGLAAAELATLLRSMRSPTPISELQRQGLDRGLKDGDGLTNLVAQLVGAGVATECRQPRGRAASIRIHGRGPLSDLLVEALRCSGARIAQSSQPHAAVSPTAVDLVVLSDYLLADPRMVRDLHTRGVPHLPVRVRDGTGLVGPLVIPGVTSCLGCPKRGLLNQEKAPATADTALGRYPPWSASNAPSCRPIPAGPARPSRCAGARVGIFSERNFPHVPAVAPSGEDWRRHDLRH